jgi:hypothetical protein
VATTYTLKGLSVNKAGIWNTANPPTVSVAVTPSGAALAPSSSAGTLSCAVIYSGGMFRWQPTLAIATPDPNTQLVNYQIQTYTDATKATVIAAWGTYIDAAYPGAAGSFTSTNGAAQPVTGAAEFVDMRAQFLSPEGIASYSNTVDASVSAGSGLAPQPITAFSVSFEIEGTAAQGGGTFTPNAAGVLVQTGTSAHSIGDALGAGVQAYRATFNVGVPNDPTTCGIYVMHAIYPDASFGSPYPETGSGWFADGWGIVVNAEPPKGATYTCYSGWIALTTAGFQEFTARTYNWDQTPVMTAPGSALIAKVQLPSGYQTQVFLINGA